MVPDPQPPAPQDPAAPGGVTAETEKSDEELFFQLSADLFCTASTDTGHFIRLNDNWTSVFGYSLDELRAEPFVSFVHPDDREATAAASRQLEQGKSVVNFLNRYRRKDGTYRYLEWTSSVLARRGLIVAVAHDVTERIETSKRLRFSEMLLREVARGAPIIIAAFDPEGRFTAHIGSGLKKLGLGENQLKGQLVFDAVPGAEPESFDFLREALTGRENRSTHTLGEGIWDSWFSPLKDTDGQIIGALTVSTDVTERERSRKLLEDRLRLIEDQSRLIRDLTAPIIEIWEGVLVLPVLGQLDRERAQVLTNGLLETISARGSRYAILDLTAVEVMDTSTAQHLVQMVQAVRLLGTQGLLSGIRSSVAQAVVSLGVDLSQVVTVSTLHAALRLCIGSAVSGPSPRR